MKKILLSLTIVAASFAANAQVICAGISPGNIAGNYDFTWADPAGGDWSSPDFNMPGVFIEDTLAIVDDGTPGDNPEGNPVSAEGCFPLINGVDVNGKIAVIYRNTCEFGEKALNAQNAGAVGAIIINRDPEVVGMAGGTQGANVTIPVVMISSTDGLILTNEMLNGPVVMFIGNKTGVFADDAGITPGTTLISKSSGVPSQLAQSGSEFNFDIGSRVYNYGTNDQAAMNLVVTIDGPNGNVYNETVAVPSIASGDSIDIDPTQALNFPQFSLASYDAGRYTLTYNLDLGGTDEYDADNTVTADFVIQDSIYALASLDNTTNQPSQNNGFRPNGNNSTFSNCIVFDNPNGSRIGVEGLYFQALGTDVDLSGEEIALTVYEWQDVFTDINDAALAFNTLNPIGGGFYYYPSDLQGETVYGALEQAVALSDNQRYLFCAQTVNLEVFLGFDTRVNYLWNEAYYAQPLGPIENDGTWFAAGFGLDVVPAVGAKIIDAGSIGLDESGTIEGIAYPNPAKDIVTLSIETTGTAHITVSDLAGKVVLTTDASFVNGNTEVNIESLETGAYMFNVSLENGLTSQFSVIKD